jgi:hypothetical protein
LTGQLKAEASPCEAASARSRSGSLEVSHRRIVAMQRWRSSSEGVPLPGTMSAASWKAVRTAGRPEVLYHLS